MCPVYVSGLIGPGDRKSIQPMAERLAAGDYDQLHHFIAAGVWDAKPVETELLVQADKLVGGSDAVLVIDDTAIPKKGTHSVGVAAQYATALGKTENCQTLVSLTLARGEVPVMLALRLFSSRELDGRPDSVASSGCPGRLSNSTNEAGVGSAGDRSRHCGWCALWLRLGGCRLRTERTVLPGAHSAQTGLGGRYPAAPQGISCRCADDLAGCQARSSASAARPRHSLDTCRRDADQGQMAHHQLAHRHERKAEGAFCRRSRAGRRRTTAADQGQGSATSARG
jgi:hypothetical protein